MHDAAADLVALAEIYRRVDGTMRQCDRSGTSLCVEKRCQIIGCFRANQILSGMKEAPRDE